MNGRFWKGEFPQQRPPLSVLAPFCKLLKLGKLLLKGLPPDVEVEGGAIKDNIFCFNFTLSCMPFSLGDLLRGRGWGGLDACQIKSAQLEMFSNGL